jgi:outer membrane protein OmpA-like peptidoglycan-associated protein
MRMRVLLAAGALAIVPALAGAQQRPATPPAQQPRPATPPTAQPRPATPPTQQPRPAAQPAQRPAAAPVARPAVAAAHREGSFELTLGGGLFAIDQAQAGYMTRSASPKRFLFGGEARATYNISRNFGIGVGAGLGTGKLASTGSSATLLSPFAAVTYTLNLNKSFSPFLEIGAGMNRFTGVSRPINSSYAGFGGLGVRSMIGENLALRLEGRMAYDKYDELSNAAYNGAAFLGLSYFIGGGPPKDTDLDGVPDRKDKCVNTPRGARVQPVTNATRAGCPIDSDNDGVWDGLDQCANTAANARPVYPIGNPRAGCPVDTDNDGLPDYQDRCANTPANARPVYPATDAARAGCPVDTDNDSVPDYLDRCANTAAGVPVDANGCPRDSDNDGITDDQDRCPNTPANARPVYPAGHARAGCPVDTDGDGVADYLDRCANTAAGTQVDANGCPVQRDADSDGVIDENDRCANTPPNTRVDATGCPFHELPAAGAVLVLRNITFRSNTATLLPVSNAELDKIAIAILATPNSRWEVGGYTDNRGVAARNQRLSQQRAQTVMQYLVSKNVPAASLTAVGYGSQRPAAPNTTVAGRAQNRRVEIKRVQ